MALIATMFKRVCRQTVLHGIRRSLLFVAALFVAGVLPAQVAGVKGDHYRSQYVKLYKSYLGDTNDVDVLVKLADFYSDDGNPMYNLPFARKYIVRAEKNYREMLSDNKHDRELRRLIGHGITLKSLAETKTRITRQAAKKLADEDMTVVQVDQYIETFADEKNVIRQARLRRVNAAYQTVLRQNTIEAYVSFQKQYPGTDEAQSAEKHVEMIVDSLYATSDNDEAVTDYLLSYGDSPQVAKLVKQHRSEAAYHEACRENTVESYKKFLNEYPASSHTMELLARIDSLLARQYASLETAQDYVNFAVANAGDNLSDKAIDEVYRKVMEENDVQAALLFLKHFDVDPRYNAVYKRYYEWHSQESCYHLIEKFSQQHSDYLFKSAVKDDLMEAADAEAVDLSALFDESKFWNYSELIKSFRDSRIAFVALQRILQPSVMQRNWAAALERCEMYDGLFQGYNKTSYDALHELLLQPYDKKREPDEIKLGGERVLNAVVAPSGETMYYTSIDNSGHRGVYQAEKRNGAWVPSGKVQIEGCQAVDATVFSLFDDGRKMLVGDGNDVMIVTNSPNGWRVTEIPPYPLNTDFVETDAFMLPDGSGMLLASDRPNGYNVQKSGMNYHGDTALASDLYFIPYTPTGWGEPVNLGFRVNSCYSERHPVVSKDMLTLYFVSDCGGGLGYGDIYVAHRTDAGNWREWSQPVNLGKEANTSFAEAGLSLHPDGRRLVFTSVRDGVANRLFVTDVAGLGDVSFSRLCFDDATGKPDMVDCRVFDAATGGELDVVHNGDRRCLVVQNGHPYIIALAMKSQWQPLFQVSGGKDSVIAASGSSAQQLVGKTFVLSYVDVSSDASEVSAVGRAEIEHIAAFLKKNDALAIDLVVNYPGLSVSESLDKSVEAGNRLKELFLSDGLEANRVSVVGRGNLDSKTPGAAPSVSVRFKNR